MSHSPFVRFDECKLSAVEAIDFYFARLMSEGTALDAPSASIWFHGVVALSVVQREGHTCLELGHIADQRLFYDDDEEVEGYRFAPLPKLVEVVQQALRSDRLAQALYLSGTRLYTRRYWEFEQTVASALRKRQEMLTLTDDQYVRLAALWPALFPAQPAAEQDWQQIATAASLVKRFVVINGGPGTGKTYTVTRLLLALQCAWHGELKIQLAAPTGKAAQRLSESIATSLASISGEQIQALEGSLPRHAVTLHQLLGLERFTIAAKRHSGAPLDCDVLIIDEASMVDLALMARVVRALTPQCRLIMLGDADQLPAVESGNVLDALTTNSARTPAVSQSMAAHIRKLCPRLPALDTSSGATDFIHSLRVSQRFEGKLAEVATAIREGDAEAAWERTTPLPADMFTGSHFEEGVAQCSLEQAMAGLESLAKSCFGSISRSPNLSAAMAALQACRWLTPVRKGPIGAEQLNALAQRVLAPAAGGWQSGEGTSYYKGRPIMVMENNYAQSLFNGDVGVVWPDTDGKLKAWFESSAGNYRAVSLARLPRVETVYAMTIHKSQGSEFAEVVMFIPEASNSQLARLCSRELIYTGLTRARKRCLLLSEKQAFYAAVKRRQQRFSGLPELLVAAQENGANKDG